jgi:hypothetical protein
MAIFTDNFNPFVATNNGDAIGFLNSAVNPLAALARYRTGFNSFVNSRGTPDLSKPISPIGGRRPYMGVPLTASTRPVPSPGDPGNSVGYPGAWSTGTPSVAKDARMPNWMKQARDTLQGVDYSGVASQYRDNAAVARARVASLYKALQRERGDAEAIYQGYRDTAEESIGASADQASADIAAGYESALQNQADEMAALGLADTLAQSATANMAEDQGYNMGTSARLGNAYQNANTLGGAADLAYNQGMIGSAGFASAEGQAQIDQQLSNLLANLAMQEQQSNAQLPMQQLQYAQGLQGLYQADQPAGLSVSDEIALKRIAADETRTLNERVDVMVRFFMDKENMTLEQAQAAANQYFG